MRNVLLSFTYILIYMLFYSSDSLCHTSPRIHIFELVFMKPHSTTCSLYIGNDIDKEMEIHPVMKNNSPYEYTIGLGLVAPLCSMK